MTPAASHAYVEMEIDAKLVALASKYPGKQSQFVGQELSMIFRTLLDFIEREDKSLDSIASFKVFIQAIPVDSK